MITQMPLFQIYGAMARHAAEAQRVSAANVANADQPGYKAVQVEPFETYLTRLSVSAGQDAGDTVRTRLADTPASPNGNTVSLEREVFQSAEAAGQHDLAMTVYAKSLDLLGTVIGKRR